MIGVITVLVFGLYVEMTRKRGTGENLSRSSAALGILSAVLVGYGAHSLVTALIQWARS